MLSVINKVERLPFAGRLLKVASSKSCICTGRGEGIKNEHMGYESLISLGFLFIKFIIV